CTKNWWIPPSQPLCHPTFESVPMQTHGAEYLDNNQTRFRLWAPDAQRVVIEFDSGDRHPLLRSDGGWFSHTFDVGPGTLYRFIVNDGVRVPDPASRFQPQG